MKKETFAQARARLLQEARAAGYPVQVLSGNGSGKLLKAPRITFPSRGGDRVIELSPQSAHDVESGLSLWTDYRGISLADLARRAGVS